MHLLLLKSCSQWKWLKNLPFFQVECWKVKGLWKVRFHDDTCCKASNWIAAALHWKVEKLPFPIFPLINWVRVILARPVWLIELMWSKSTLEHVLKSSIRRRLLQGGLSRVFWACSMFCWMKFRFNWTLHCPSISETMPKSTLSITFRRFLIMVKSRLNCSRSASEQSSLLLFKFND